MKKVLSNSLFHVLLIMALGTVIYSGTFHVPFHFDDMKNIKENFIVHDLKYFSNPQLAAGQLRYQALRSRYVGYLTFALNYRFGGQNVTGYHVVNLCIHILNALLVYLFVVLTFRTPALRDVPLRKLSRWAALLAAALFVSHPVETQAVTYIVQRLASLAALFYIGSLTAYISARLSRKRFGQIALYLVALCLAVLAMKTKENTFTLPLAITLYELLFFWDDWRGDWKKRALLLVPILLTMSIIPYTFLEQGKPIVDTMQSIETRIVEHPIPRAQYMITQLRVLVTYLRLLVFPMNQNLDYDYPLYSSLLQIPVLLSLLLHGTLIFFGVFLLKKERKEFRLISFGIFFFYLAMSVESGIIPLYPIFEHRVYLPSIGAFTALSVAAMFFYMTITKRHVRGALAVGLVVMILALATAAWKRNTVWHSNVSLWTDVVSKSPLESRARNNLGNSYYMIGMFGEALEQYERAVKYDPKSSLALSNIGLILLSTDRVEESIQYFKKAIKYEPANAEAYNNLGSAYLSLGKAQEAIEQFRNAVHFNPGLPAPHANLGRCYLKQGDLAEAKQQLLMAISLDPNDQASRKLLLTIKMQGE